MKGGIEVAATIKDIAKQTGLGLATISSYLNGGNVREKNRIKIEQAIEELHFEVNEMARGLKTNRTKLIGVIIPELNNIFCAEIITEVEDILRRYGYAIMLCDCRTDEKREEEAVEFLKKRRVDGVIVIPSGSKSAHLQNLMDAGIPVVLIDRKLKGLDCDCVLVDNRGCTRLAMEKLLAAGHRKIGMIAGPDEIYTASERLEGYYEAMKDVGIGGCNSLVVRGDYTIKGGTRAFKELIEKNPDMTAVFVSNYEMMVGAMMEANELGIRIPEQISLVGFDNVEFAKACVPKLSIVSQPTIEIAKEAADMMLRRLSEGREAKSVQVSLSAEYIEGKSIKRREERP